MRTGVLKSSDHNTCCHVGLNDEESVKPGPHNTVLILRPVHVHATGELLINVRSTC